MRSFAGRDILSLKDFERQEFFRVFEIAARLEPIARERQMSDLLTGKIPVSYTHLDVYKRQMLYFVNQRNQALGLLRQEQAKSEALLRNILPDDVAADLKEHGRTTARHYGPVSYTHLHSEQPTPHARHRSEQCGR